MGKLKQKRTKWPAWDLREANTESLVIQPLIGLSYYPIFSTLNNEESSFLYIQWVDQGMTGIWF